MSLDPRSYDLNGRPPAIQEDWPVLSNFANLLADGFYPPVNQVGVQRVFSGWPTFTPDGKFIIGKTKRVGGFVMAAGCNAHGVSGSAGIGHHVVESLSANPSEYVKSLSPDRFQDGTWQWDSSQKQARGIYETYYDLLPSLKNSGLMGKSSSAAVKSQGLGQVNSPDNTPNNPPTKAM